MMLRGEAQNITSKLDVSKPSTFLGFRHVAVIELLLIFAVLLIIDYAFYDGSIYLGINPHPFWIPVLIFAIQYGTNEALLAALLSSLLYFASGLPAQLFTQDTYSYLLSVGMDPILWFVSAVILGELRSRQIVEKNELKSAFQKLQRENELISKTYEKLKLVKIDLDTQIASQLNTVTSTYHAARQIDQLTEDVFFCWIKNLINNTLGVDSFSVYLTKGDHLGLYMQEGWSDTDHYEKRFSSNSPLFRSIVVEQRFLNVSQQNDERILDGHGSLAGPLIKADSGEVFGMLKVESQQFINFNQSSVERFHVVCEWISEAYTQIKHNQQSMIKKTSKNPLALKDGYQKRENDSNNRNIKKTEFLVTVIFVKAMLLDDLSLEKHAAFKTAIYEAQKNLRQSDQVFNVGGSDSLYILLLPQTSETGADFVAKKYKLYVQHRLPKLLQNIPMQIRIEKLPASYPENSISING